MKKQVTTINNSKIYYWVRNPEQESTILMVHGFRGNHRALTKFAYQFKERVILLDLPGYGESQPMADEHSLDNFANFLMDFIKELNITNNLLLIGHSYGASICMNFASHTPKELTGLVLINPSISADNLFNKFGDLYIKSVDFLPQRWRKAWLANRLFDLVGAEVLIKNVSYKRKQQLIKDGQRNLKDARPQVIVESFTSYRYSNTYNIAAKITTPTLIIAGALDRLALTSKVQELATHIQNVELNVVERHGHLVPLERPVHTATLTKRFFESINKK